MVVCSTVCGPKEEGSTRDNMSAPKQQQQQQQQQQTNKRRGEGD